MHGSFGVMAIHTLQHPSDCKLYRDPCNIYELYRDDLSHANQAELLQTFPSNITSVSGKSILSKEYFRLTAKLITTKAPLINSVFFFGNLFIAVGFDLLRVKRQ